MVLHVLQDIVDHIALVEVVNPGFLQTPSVQALMTLRPHLLAVLAQVEAQVPLEALASQVYALLPRLTQAAPAILAPHALVMDQEFAEGDQGDN